MCGLSWKREYIWTLDNMVLSLKYDKKQFVRHIKSYYKLGLNIRKTYYFHKEKREILLQKKYINDFIEVCKYKKYLRWDKYKYYTI